MFYKKKYLKAIEKLESKGAEIEYLRTRIEAFDYACYQNFIDNHTPEDLKKLKEMARWKPTYWSDTLQLSSYLYKTFREWELGEK